MLNGVVLPIVDGRNWDGIKCDVCHCEFDAYDRREHADMSRLELECMFCDTPLIVTRTVKTVVAAQIDSQTSK